MTTPANLPDTSETTVSNAPGSTTGLTPSCTIGTTHSGSSISSTEDILVYQNTCLYHPNWPTGLVLDWLKSNWEEWDRRLNTIVDQRYYGNYLDGTLRCPDSTTHPRSAINWNLNNRALRALYSSIFPIMITPLQVHTRTLTTYMRPYAKTTCNSRLAKINVFREALGTRCVPTVPLSRTFDQITKLHTKFIKMGKMDDDLLLIILILNALGGDYTRLQTSVIDMLQNPLTTSADIRARLYREEQTIALGFVTGNPTRPVCANCKSANHRTEYCISPRGQMAGRTISEAHAARIAQRRASYQPRSNGAGITIQSQASTSDYPKTLILDGKCYMLVSR